MVAKEHPEVIGGRRRLITVDVIDSKEAAEDDSIDHGGVALDEEDESSLVGAGVPEEVEDIQKDLKYYSLSYYMLKPSNLLTQVFDNNRTEQEKLFTHIYNFGARAELREGRRVVGYYLDVDTTKYQCRILNPKNL